jgi:hypothetical protein
MIFALVLGESVALALALALALAGAALGVLLLQGAFIAGRAGARSPAGTGHRRLAPPGRGNPPSSAVAQAIAEARRDAVTKESHPYRHQCNRCPPVLRGRAAEL